ncbi:MAG: TIGR04282 family arsenosugar biosynthesis glycosyltransferase [Pseudomonadota bacterium]
MTDRRGRRTRPTVVIMVKEPRPGRVKTRLGRDIGQTVATWWFRHQVRRLVRRIGRDRRWDCVLAVAPDTALGTRALPEGMRRTPQGRGDLGQRMIRQLDRFRPGPVLVVGADIPGLGAREVAGALAALRGHDTVIGPAPDGGYWLIGVRSGLSLRPEALDGVRWSGPHARHDTLRALGNYRIAIAAELADVDTAEDLRSPG